MPRILLLAPDVPPAPGVLAAGPGIRYAELARALRAAGIDVTLAAPEASPAADAVWEPPTVRELAEGHDAVVLPQSHAELGRQVARRLPRDLPVVVDLYAPLLVENLALAHAPQDASGFEWLHGRAVELLRRADLLLVADERQRLYAIGLLSALGRLNPLTYAEPPLLRVPYGVPAEPPAPSAGTAPQARGVLVPEEAPLALWYGGIYPWFDAQTAVRGFARTLERLPAAHLVIVGGRHPRAHAPDQEYRAALAAAAPIRSAVHEAPWGPYEQRTAWYAEADCAICLHHAGLETDLAHRTRLTDLLWGRVPFVCSEGDAVGQRAAEAGAAIAVPVGDAEAAGDALATLLGDPELRQRCRTAAAGLAAKLAWPTVLAPLVDWLQAPRIAADRFAAPSWGPALRAVGRAALDARRR